MGARPKFTLNSPYGQAYVHAKACLTINKRKTLWQDKL